MVKDKLYLCSLLHVLTSAQLFLHCSSDLPGLVLQLPSGHICLQGELKQEYREGILANNIDITNVFLRTKGRTITFLQQIS